jgi:hypothetical protein
LAYAINILRKNSLNSQLFFLLSLLGGERLVSAYTRLSSDSLLQKHDYKTLHAIKEGRPSFYNMFKNIQFVYVLHKIDKGGKANKI